jgi:putative transposase
MRNGCCPATIKTTAGPVTVARPKLRGTTEAFASRLFGKTITKSNALESLVIAGFVRGLSVRYVENTLAGALGAEAALSKSAVSRICQAIGDEFTAWSSRRLDGLHLDYLLLDASMFKMHPGARAEPVLAAWGITTDGALPQPRLGRPRPRQPGMVPTPSTWKAIPKDLGQQGGPVRRGPAEVTAR